MKPSKVQSEIDRLKSEYLPNGAWVAASIHGGVAHITAYSTSMHNALAVAKGDDWQEAIDSFRVALISWGVEQDMSLVRRMALAIIDLTDIDLCTPAALHRNGFSPDEISRSSRAACELAAKMSARGPFSVVIEHKAAAE